MQFKSNQRCKAYIPSFKPATYHAKDLRMPRKPMHSLNQSQSFFIHAKRIKKNVNYDFALTPEITPFLKQKFFTICFINRNTIT